jgi:hypothetical protein
VLRQRGVPASGDRQKPIVVTPVISTQDQKVIE